MKFKNFIEKYSNNKLDKISGIFDGTKDGIPSILSLSELGPEKIKDLDSNLIKSDEFLDIDTKCEYFYNSEKLIDKYKDYYIAGICTTTQLDEDSKATSTDSQDDGLTEDEYMEDVKSNSDSFDSAIDETMKSGNEVLLVLMDKSPEEMAKNERISERKRAEKLNTNFKVSSSINGYALFNVVTFEDVAYDIDNPADSYYSTKELLGIVDTEEDAYKLIKKRVGKETGMCQIEHGQINKKTFRIYYTNEFKEAFLSNF